MNHRVALYTVQVRPKRNKTGDFCILGDIDERGTSLAAVLAGYMADDFEVLNAEQTRSARCEEVTNGTNEVFAQFLHGQTGMAADIVDKAGRLRIRQSPDDTQRVRCGVLLVLPPAEERGWLAAHVNNGRAVKGLLEKGIQERFRKDFPRLVLEINPFVRGSVLLAAVQDGRIEKIKLRKLDQSTDRAGAGKWVDGGTTAKLELSITPSSRARRILSRLPQQFLQGDDSAFGEIVQYEGLRFDEARLEVTLPDGSRRTFNIEHPDAGHPFTEDIDGLVLEDGDPTGPSLQDALRRALSDVSD